MRVLLSLNLSDSQISKNCMCSLGSILHGKQTSEREWGMENIYFKLNQF